MTKPAGYVLDDRGVQVLRDAAVLTRTAGTGGGALPGRHRHGLLSPVRLAIAVDDIPAGSFNSIQTPGELIAAGQGEITFKILNTVNYEAHHNPDEEKYPALNIGNTTITKGASCLALRDQTIRGEDLHNTEAGYLVFGLNNLGEGLPPDPWYAGGAPTINLGSEVFTVYFGTVAAGSQGRQTEHFGDVVTERGGTIGRRLDGCKIKKAGLYRVHFSASLKPASGQTESSGDAAMTCNAQVRAYACNVDIFIGTELEVPPNVTGSNWEGLSICGAEIGGGIMSDEFYVELAVDDVLRLVYSPTTSPFKPDSQHQVALSGHGFSVEWIKELGL